MKLADDDERAEHLAEHGHPLWPGCCGTARYPEAAAEPPPDSPLYGEAAFYSNDWDD